MMVLSNEYIESLFDGKHFGERLENNVSEQRKFVLHTLKNQIDGYWSGRTAYHLIIDGGFLHDAKTSEQKRLTALGKAFVEANGDLVNK